MKQPQVVAVAMINYSKQIMLKVHVLAYFHSICQNILAYRTRSHRLSVEVGRWFGIPIHERRCIRCASDIGEEYYYLLICPYNKVQLTNLC